MFIFKITLPMNSSDGSFFKYDKTFASDLYLIYNLSPSAQKVATTARFIQKESSGGSRLTIPFG
jgi:hypothetical protein